MADPDKYPTRIAPYGLRLPPDLKERVQASADRRSRTMHAELLETISRAYPAPPDGAVNADAVVALLRSIEGLPNEQIEALREKLKGQSDMQIVARFNEADQIEFLIRPTPF